MAHSIRLLFILFFSIVNLNIRSIDCALPIHDQNLNNLFNQFNKVPSIIGIVHNIVERFQCPKSWTRFGSSCYLLSNTTSMPSMANQTCSRHLNNSQLMKIRHPPELSYAAYGLKVYNQLELMIEIDSQLLKGKNISDLLSAKDRFKWQQANDKFRRARDAYYSRKMNTSDQLLHEENSYDNGPVRITRDLLSKFQLISTSTDSSLMITGNKKNDYNEFDRFDVLYHSCDQLVWNVRRNDSHVFLLTTYLMFNKTVCSLSDIESDETYPHLCQYVLDYCLANEACGIFGHCTNTPTGFKCSCLFLFDGPFCRSLSGPGKQMIIVLIIIIVLQLYIRKESLKSLWSRIKGILTCCNTQQETLDNEQDDDSVVHSHDDSKERSCLRWCLFGVLSISILVLLLAIPTLYRPRLLRFDHINRSNISLVTNNFKQMVTRCKRNPIILGIIIVCSLLTFIIASAFLLMKQQREHGDFFHGLSEFLIPFKPFDIINRYETAAIFGIAVFEVLTTSNYVFIDLSKLWGIGVLTKLAQSFWNIFVIVIKYFPILISLRQKNVIICSCAFLYFMVNIAFIIFDKKSCLDLFPPSEKVSEFEEAKLYIILGNWIIGYGLIRNILYFVILAYIGAEITFRFFDALTHVQSKKSEEILVSTITRSNKTYNNVNRKSHCSRMQTAFNYIYPWDDKFRFVTISLCTYGTAFIFLYYLTCTLTFHSIIGRSSYISFLIIVVESTLNIEIQNLSFCREIILSGVLTMILFSYQLFTGMKKCKKNAKKPCQNTSENDSSTMTPAGNSITSESIGYLKHSIPCLAGGVYILFPLILFVSIIVRLIPTQFKSIEPLFSFIIPLLLLYGLQTSLMQLIHIFSPNQQSENKRTVRNDAINTFYIILITSIFIGNFHISIAACALRLFKITLVHIISGAQIDCSYLGQPSEVFEYHRKEHKAIRDTTPNSQDEYEERPNRISPTSTTQPRDPEKISSPNDDCPSSELTVDCSSQIKVPLSPDCKPIQSQQDECSTEVAHVKIDIDDPPLPKDSKLHLEDNSMEIRGLSRKRTCFTDI